MASGAQNAQQWQESKARRKAKEAVLNRRLTKEARSWARLAKRDDYQRRGLNPDTPSTRTSSEEEEEEEEEGNEADNDAAYEDFFAAVDGGERGHDVVILDVGDGSSSAALGVGMLLLYRRSVPHRPRP